MFTNKKISEAVALLGGIAPISQGAGTANSGWLSVKSAHAIMAVISTGVLGSSATVDAKIQQATSSGGANAKDITGKAITQIVKASGDGKQVFINMRGQDMDLANGFNYIQLSITVGTAASLIAGEVWAGMRYEPADVLDNATVIQIV
jgi:hypothetical protein